MYMDTAVFEVYREIKSIFLPIWYPTLVLGFNMVCPNLKRVNRPLKVTPQVDVCSFPHIADKTVMIL